MPYLLSNLCIANAKVERSKRSRQVIECAGNAGRMHVIFPNKVASLFRHSSVCNASRQQKCTAFPMDWEKHGVKIVHSDELDLNTPQTSGMTRAAAITHARGWSKQVVGRHNGGSTGCQDRTASPWRTGNRALRGKGPSSNALGRSTGTER